MSPALRASLVGGVLILGAGAAAFGYAVHQGRGRSPEAAGGREVALAVLGRSCDPMQLSVPAGRTTFVISNRGERAVEWEILDGVMVVDERENIAPGLTQRLTTDLRPGTYAMACGQLSGERGTLTVLGAQDGPAARLALEDLVGPAAEYRAWSTAQAASADEASAGLLAPAAIALGLPARAQDDAARAALRTALGTRMLLPADLAQGARGALDAAAPARILPGIRKVVELLLPLAARVDPALAARLPADLAASDTAATPDGDIPAERRGALAADLDALARGLAVDTQEASQ